MEANNIKQAYEQYKAAPKASNIILVVPSYTVLCRKIWQPFDLDREVNISDLILEGAAPVTEEAVRRVSNEVLTEFHTGRRKPYTF